MKKKIVLLAFLIIPIVLVVVYFLSRNSSTNTMFPSYTPTPSATPSSATNPPSTVVEITSSSSPSTNKQSWATFNYNFTNFNPKFSIDYPSDWDTHINYEASGQDDIILTNSRDTIHIDATIPGVPSEDHIEILKVFLTNFGSKKFDYTPELLEQSTLEGSKFTSQVPYSVFKLVSNSQNIEYAIIAQPYTLDNSKGYVFIWDKTGNNLELIKEILNSLKPIY